MNPESKEHIVSSFPNAECILKGLWPEKSIFPWSFDILYKRSLYYKTNPARFRAQNVLISLKNASTEANMKIISLWDVPLYDVIVFSPAHQFTHVV